MFKRAGQDYGTVGLQLRLSEEAKAGATPDWRMALFSLVFPLPGGCLPEVSDPQQFVELDEPWGRGRFKGVVRIEPHDRPSHWRQLPSAYYNLASHRYGIAEEEHGDPLGESLATHEVDFDLATPENSSANMRAYRLMFHDDTPALGDKPTSAQTAGLETRYFLQDKDPHAHATIELVGIEFLQYRDGPTRRGQRLSNPTRNNYLVLHVLAENCSSGLLEKISHGLHRHNRQKSVFTLSKPAESGATKVNPLKTFIDLSVDAMNATHLSKAHTQFQVELEPGGYIAVPEGQMGRRNGVGKPFRAVCAIPGKQLTTRPEIFSKSPVLQARSADKEAYSHEDLWAWTLSSGADIFAEGTPDPRVFPNDPYDFGDYLYWATATSAAGYAVVRRGTANSFDPKFWMNTNTRMLDVALLVHRSHDYLAQLTRRLRNMDFQEMWSNNEEVSHSASDRKKFEKELTASFEKFQELQADLVWFRDRLWFEAIPDHVIDTWFMQAFKLALGSQQRYNDLLAEIELRQQVYGALYNSVQAEQDRKRSNSNNYQTIALGLIAAFIALPEILHEALGMSWGYAAVIMVVLAVGVPGGFYVWQKRNGS